MKMQQMLAVEISYLSFLESKYSAVPAIYQIFFNDSTVVHTHSLNEERGIMRKPILVSLPAPMSVLVVKVYVCYICSERVK
jgi:hypothetical protein